MVRRSPSQETVLDHFAGGIPCELISLPPEGINAMKKMYYASLLKLLVCFEFETCGIARKRLSRFKKYSMRCYTGMSMLFFIMELPKAMREDSDLKMRATSFSTLVVWPGKAGVIDEASIRSNYGLLKHVPAAHALWEKVIEVPYAKWVVEALSQCWKAISGQMTMYGNVSYFLMCFFKGGCKRTHTHTRSYISSGIYPSRLTWVTSAKPVPGVSRKCPTR